MCELDGQFQSNDHILYELHMEKRNLKYQVVWVLANVESEEYR